MRFASAITTATETSQAVSELIGPVDGRVTPGMVDLAVLFLTAHFEDELPEVVEQITAALPYAVLLGCTAEGTIGVETELERIPSMSLLVASLPGVRVRPFHTCQRDVESACTEHDWERIVAVAPESDPAFIALGDPFSIVIPAFVDRISEVYPGAPLVGGVASAAHEPRQNRLIVGGEVHREGVVGVALTGRVEVDTVVSQGCRPIGRPLVITKGGRNVIQELGGVPALEQLRTLLDDLPTEDVGLVRKSLYLGRVIDEYKEVFTRGDFLIQSIIGLDRFSGAIAIVGHARVGATVQFHVRDAASADEDLRTLLARHVGSGVKGAMLFGCSERGSNMWPKAGHDAGVVHELLGDIPLAGFFCGGEFGPIGGANFVHGFTASLALFREPSGESYSPQEP